MGLMAIDTNRNAPHKLLLFSASLTIKNMPNLAVHNFLSALSIFLLSHGYKVLY